MKKINYIKYVLDLLMGVTFALLFNKRVIAGLTFHEIAGLIIGIAFITHILLNWRWVKNVSRQIFNRKLAAKVRFGYCLNLLLLITMIAIISSGILISKVVFPRLNIGNGPLFKIMHLSLPFVALILIGIHVGLHWKWVVSVSKRLLHLPKAVKWGRYAARLAVVLLLAFGSYEMYSTGFISRVASAVNIVSINSAQGMNIGEHKGEAGGNRQEGNRPEFAGGKPGGTGDRPAGKDNRSGGNPPDIIITYFAITSVFIIVTYYLDKYQTKRTSTS